MGGFLGVDGELPDYLLETDCVMAGVMAERPARNEPLIRPSAGGGVGGKCRRVTLRRSFRSLIHRRSGPDRSFRQG
jgi:hypothetical protein